MVIDTSALAAILLGEPEGSVFALAIAEASVRLVSAATLLEASIVLESKRGEAGGRELDLLLHRAAVVVVPVTPAQAELARAAWRRFGKGRPLDGGADGGTHRRHELPVAGVGAVATRDARQGLWRARDRQGRAARGHRSPGPRAPGDSHR